MVNGYKKILPGQVFHMDGTQCTMGIMQRSGGNRVLDGRRKTLPGTGVEKFGWTVAKILCLDGCQNTLFEWASKFFVWTGVKICLLDQRPKFGLWNSSWRGIKKFPLGGPDNLMDNAWGGHAIGC